MRISDWIQTCALPIYCRSRTFRLVGRLCRLRLHAYLPVPRCTTSPFKTNSRFVFLGLTFVQGERMTRNTLFTAFFFPGPLFGIAFFLNFFLWYRHSRLDRKSTRPNSSN